ncbi:hypothetical protein DP091_20220 [Paenibacillus sp. MDMC362]|nr:hypothetical protein DP091_20220 [Paenibacillus sp. MDMC362]
MRNYTRMDPNQVQENNQVRWIPYFIRSKRVRNTFVNKCRVKK